MSTRSIIARVILSGILCLVATAFSTSRASAQEVAAASAPKEDLAGLNKALAEAKEGSSNARHRLAIRRVIRDAEQLLGTVGNSPDRFPVLEFLFRARQQLIAIDDEAEHRKALLETCRELVKAPDEMAGLRLEADLLLSQAELARQGANAEERAQALRPLVARYLGTPVGAKVLRMAMIMALELGDSRVVTDLQEMMEENFASDLDIINFQRDKLGGQVFGAPFCGSFERSDGKVVRFPMDGLGRMTLCVFWSKEGDGLKFIEGLAAAAKEKKDDMAGRLEIVSFNLDNLPDAGESILRGQGVEWQALRLPGGRENPIYKAYARNDPRMLSVSPTGYAALFLSGTTRDKVDPTADTDFGRSLGSILSRNWADERYTMQITSLTAGDFLVLDPEGGIHPALPPELKATAKEGAATPLAPGTAEVPEETLRAIQACFIAPPQRYRLTHSEALANYGKAAELCRKAMADHPSATNLWIVRNRLIIALMGLWKTNSDPRSLEEAIVEAKSALAAGYPRGCDVIARFCTARGALRHPAAEPHKTVEGFLADCGGESAPGPAYAAASLLALDVADRQSFERFRKEILHKHTENPMMWTYAAFLLDRHHRYWLFQFPFSAGWSYGHRENYAKSVGIPEEGHRILKTELQTLEGKPLRIPEDLDSEWTLIVFAQPALGHHWCHHLCGRPPGG